MSKIAINEDTSIPLIFVNPLNIPRVADSIGLQILSNINTILLLGFGFTQDKRAFINRAQYKNNIKVWKICANKTNIVFILLQYHKKVLKSSKFYPA